MQEAEEKKEQCRHINCTCEAMEGESYCSPHCEAIPYEASCTCGHAGCGSDPTVKVM